MNTGLTHSDIITMENCGELYTPYEPHTFICECGNEIEEGSSAAYWHMPNGDIVCDDCIQEYMEEYFSRYRLEA